jgi:hypothetical protein
MVESAVQMTPSHSELVARVRGSIDVQASEATSQDTGVGLREEEGDPASHEGHDVAVGVSDAEGSKKATNAGYARYLNIAEGSLAETEYLLILSRDLGYTDAATVDPTFGRIADLARMLHALRRKVEQGA